MTGAVIGEGTEQDDTRVTDTEQRVYVLRCSTLELSGLDRAGVQACAWHVSVCVGSTRATNLALARNAVWAWPDTIIRIEPLMRPQQFAYCPRCSLLY